MTEELSPTRIEMGAFAPKLAALTDDLLFDDIWAGPELSKRDRSLITVAALVAGYRSAELRFHLPLAVENGVTKEELIGLITHLAFYAGWPCSMTAIEIARDVLDLDGTSGISV